MRFETLKNRKWKFIVGGIALILIGATIMLNTSRAKYRTTQSIPIYRGIINYKPYDFKMMAMYQEDDSGEYTEIETMPSSGYVINEEKSYCYINSSSEKDSNAKLYTDEKGQHVFANLSKNSKCYLYFDIQVSASETILAEKTIRERTDFSVAYTEETTNTLFTAQDDDGTSYYYAGASTDNYVKFAGYYWRIIRINGDGSIRLIYQGESATGTNAQIGTSDFNTSRNDNMYVGYMYTSGEVHGTQTSSTIKGVLDDWYSKKLINYVSYIDYNAGFCGDRTPYLESGEYPNYTYTSGGGTGTTDTYYGAFIRLNSKAPALKCSNSSDLYTVSESSKGNKALTYPIGLISVDEVVYAGGIGSENKNYYLYTGQVYWTMSPLFLGLLADSNGDLIPVVGQIGNNGSLGINLDSGTTSIQGVRPVINLRADTKFKDGSLGTMESPYVVVGAE